MNVLFLAVCLLIAAASGVVAATTNDDLKAGFTNPPHSARPQTWWHWMNGNITREGIIADLEAMKQIGLGGATVVNVDCGIPAGPVKFMSPEWRDDFKFAVQEAHRLGLELCVENCAGWSSSGGPWNTPTNAMQRLTVSETNIQGPTLMNTMLPKPTVNLGFYREVAVLAFKAPAMQDKNNSLTPDAPGKLTVQRAVYASGSGSGFADVTSRIIERIQRGEKSMAVNNGEMGGDPANGSYKQLRLEFTLDDKPEILVLDENETLIFPTSQSRLKQARAQHKGSFEQTFVQPAAPATEDNGEPIPQDGIVDLSDKITADGRLNWQVPAGDWIILRFGYTPIGVNNHPAPKEGEGLECDKLSKAALDAHWDGFMGKILSDIGPLAGKSLNCSLIDSYEVGNQDWTENFREEFKQRRGYDPVKFLPTFTHRIVENPEVTERFLWDMRRTVADLFAENYYAHFAELCKKNGLLNAVEPYTGPFESLQCGASADVVMGEFWAGSGGHPSIKLVASLAHIYGKAIVGAESFTAGEPQGRWTKDPYSLKPLGDLMFCQGLNRYIFHRYAMQPWTNRWPGMTMGEYGLQFERTLTWWQQGKYWIDYISRCQFLLQQGRAATDVAYFTGEGAPMEMRASDPALPEGYDFDAVNSDVLLHGATVKNGRLVLASGASYAVLVLPAGDTTMSPQLLKHIRELVQAGATVLGSPPKSAPGLAGYPESDHEVQQLAAELWGKCDGTNVQENQFGQGRVIWGKSLAEVLNSQNVRPDFLVGSATSKANLAFAHRTDSRQEIYFVSNQRERFETAECVFRVAGKIPELWHPDTGITERAPVWSATNGCTTLRLSFDPAGSVFVIFREPAGEVDHVASVEEGFAPLKKFAEDQPGLEIKKAIYGAVDDVLARDVTAQVTAIMKSGQLTVPANNYSLGGDPATNQVKELRVSLVTDGQPARMVVREGEVLTLPSHANFDTPVCEMKSAEDGTPYVRVWRNGQFTFTTAHGKKLQANVSGLPARQEVTGAWQVGFAPGWDAPETIQFDQLISWTQHTTNAVRYFSGTATYEKEITISPVWLDSGRELWLDLGTVKNFAEVFLNDQNLGTLWKPPFRINITPAAKTGTNRLVIKVTNLWPNRLIGDEQLPEDCEWTGHQLKAWPQWLLDGKPSPTGRKTFATWRFYTKDSPLMESGLIGPVTLQPAVLPTVGEAYINPATLLGSWIWDKTTFDGQTCQLWRSFEIPAGVKVTKARFALSADDEFTLFLDGRELGRGVDWREVNDFDSIAPLLSAGKHTVVIKAFNSFHSAGVIFGAHIELSDGRIVEFKSDETWRIIPEETKKFMRVTEAPPNWPAAEIKAPLNADPWFPMSGSINKMPVLTPVKILFWQRGWFQVALAVACGLAIIYSLRLMAQLALHRKERKLLQQERARIAREIHDDIGARMTQLVLQGEVAQNEMSNPAKARTQLVELCDEARNLLSTMDEILWAVNPQRDAVRDFASYICDYTQNFLKNTSIQPVLDVDNGISEMALDLPARRSLLMAIKEALNNAVKYSEATELQLKIHNQGQRLLVVVQDNGKGFDSAKVKPGRDGLTNMTNRLNEIGGTCLISASPGNGCRLEFSVPLHRSLRG